MGVQFQEIETLVVSLFPAGRSQGLTESLEGWRDGFQEQFTSAVMQTAWSHGGPVWQTAGMLARD
jgi:hypothetical protein